MNALPASYVSPLAFVEGDELPADVTIHPFAVVRAGARIGRGVVIHPHVCIEAGVVLGDGVEVLHGAVVGREPKAAGAVSRPVSFNREVEIGDYTIIGPHAVIYYDVRVGSNTLIGDGASVREQCEIGSRCLISRGVTVNYNTKIGDGVKIMDLSHITGDCIIEDGVFISTLVATVNDNALGKEGYQGDKIVGPHIEAGAMVGAAATLLPGVRVGRDAVVGAGAVVTRDVESKTLVMGTPARWIRTLK